jgi:hypothetical protein
VYASDPATLRVTSVASVYVHVPWTGQRLAPPPPLGVHRGSAESLGEVLISWSGVAPFDVVAGDLAAALRGGNAYGADFGGAKALTCGTTDTETTHSAPNVPGTVTYYLLRESASAIGWNDDHRLGDRNRSLTACSP